MASSKEKKWEQQALDAIAEADKITYLGSKHPNLPANLHPNFQVYEYSPSKELDGDERYYLAGPEWSIIQQSSQTKVIHDILANRLGYGFTFEKWFEDWEKGWKGLINRTGPVKTLSTNYPISDVKREGITVEGWRKTASQRPGYIEWKNPNKKANPPYRVIEYWPDRSVKETSYVLTGSDVQIIEQILRLEYQTGGNAIAETDGFEGGWYGIRTGQPKILLSFWEDIEDLEAGFNRVQGRLRFRIMDKTDDPDGTLPKISWTDIRQYRDRVFQQFQQPNGGLGLIWKKGKDMLVYTDRPRGYQSRILCRDETGGRLILSAMLAVQQHQINERKLNFSSPVQPTLAHPTIPEQKTILNKLVKLPRTRPIADVRFSRAVMYLQYWREPIVLVQDRQVQPLPSD
jgi:hypothetical protein